MFLKDKKSGDLIEILSVDSLIDPCRKSFDGRFHAGEEIQEASEIAKAAVVFPSGESLPRCWLDQNYHAN